MELQHNDNLKNLVDCWKTETSNIPHHSDEKRMIEFWQKCSAKFAKNVDEEKGKQRVAGILEFLEDSGFNPAGSKVLDIGCGPGTLSLPLARLGAEVTALDISCGMLDRLRETAENENLSVKPMECSWWSADIDSLGLRGKYDLVLASMTPGVNDIESFEKMTACSRGFCYYSNFVHRNEDQSHNVLRSMIFGEQEAGGKTLNAHGSGMFFPFMYLYISGFRPLIKVSHFEGKEESSWEEAAERASAFLAHGRDLDDDKVQKIRDYFRDKSPDGIYRTESDVYTGMMIWTVNGR
jgi:SAM-dependent methyltransferase